MALSLADLLKQAQATADRLAIPALSPPGAMKGLLDYGEWYTLRLGGTKMPGKWRVVGGSLRIKLDPKNKAGADGANPVLHGMQPQAFEVEGEQYTNDERSELAKALRNLDNSLMPVAGQTRNQKPLAMQHPQIAHFGNTVNVLVVGCGLLEVTGPCVTKLRLTLQHWLPPKGAATNQPNQARRQIKNVRGNPPPSQQSGAGNPPSGLQKSGG